MPASTRSRKGHNNPYIFEELLGNVHRSAAGSLWRWRTEFALVSGLTGWAYWMAQAITVTWTLVMMTGVTGLLTLIPPVRGYVKGRAWCLITRHRMQRVFWEARLHTRSGRLPLIMRIKPTEVGERIWVWTRAGIPVEDFETHKEDIRSACYARDARVARDMRYSHLITIDVIRHDTLRAAAQVKPHVIRQLVPNSTQAVTGRAGNLARRFTVSIPRWLRRMPARS